MSQGPVAAHAPYLLNMHQLCKHIGYQLMDTCTRNLRDAWHTRAATTYTATTTQTQPSDDQHWEGGNAMHPSTFSPYHLVQEGGRMV